MWKLIIVYNILIRNTQVLQVISTHTTTCINI